MPSWSLTDWIVTTESATAAATLANRPAGASLLPLVDSDTLEVVNASTTSAVLRPTTAADQADQQRQHGQHRKRQIGHPPAEQHVTDAEPAARDRRRRGRRHARPPESPRARGRTGIAPGVLGVVGLVLALPSASAPASVGWRCSESAPGNGRPKASVKDRVGGFVVRGELDLRRGTSTGAPARRRTSPRRRRDG